MLIQVACPSCAKQYNLAEKFAGKKVRCQACQATISVPGDGTTNGTTASAPANSPALQTAKPSVKKAAPETEAAKPDKPQPPKAKSKAWLFLLLGGVLFLFLFCIGGPVVGLVAWFYVLTPKVVVVSNAPPKTELMSGPTQSIEIVPPTYPVTKSPPPTTQPPATTPTPPATTPKPPVTTPEPDDEPAGPKLDADPMPQPLQAPSNPGGTIPLGGANSPAVGRNDPVRYPWGPSPIVAVQSGKNRQWDVWNVQSMKQLGSVAGDSGADAKVSNDGVYFALPIFGAGIKPSGYEIFTVADGKSLRKLTPNGGFDSLGGVIDFAGPGQFLYLQNEVAGSAATVWDVKRGNQVASFKTVGAPDRKAMAVSPGGRYLAMFDSLDPKHPIQVYEVATGNVVRTIKPKLPQAQYYRCLGMAFSNDGKELAAIIDGPGNNWLQAWDFEIGKRTANFSFTPTLAKTAKATPANFIPTPLECLPDRSGWFAYGQLMIDHERGNVFWSLPPEDPKVPMQRRFLDADHLMTVMVKGPRQRQLEIITLPKDEIAAARKK